jgi:hypothetical protein
MQLPETTIRCNACLSPHRHRRLRNDSPRPEWRPQLTEPLEVTGVIVDTIGGCRSVLALVEDGDR